MKLVSADARRVFDISGGVWIDEPSSNYDIYKNIKKEANYNVYNESSLTTTYFAKTT